MRQNFSHTPGAGGQPVRAHYHARVELANGRVVDIRAYPNGTPFTADENARVEKDSAGRKQERRERFDQKRNRRGGPRGAIDGRLAAALGATGIFFMVGEAYGEYVSTGAQAGASLAKRVGLSRALQILGVAGELPDGRYFQFQQPDGTITHVRLVQQDEQWYFVAYHWREPKNQIFSTGPELVYDIPPGKAPAYHTPNAPAVPADIQQQANEMKGPDRVDPKHIAIVAE
jgi:hypothetical protein